MFDHLHNIYVKPHNRNTEKLRASFAETPAITLVKSALETHADKERTVEAICWFLQNASFNGT